MKSEEIWKDIRGYKGFYQVSNLGRVKRLSGKCKSRHGNRRVPEKILRPGLNEWEYRYVVLWKNGTAQMKKVHRLVANAFIPKVKGKPEVDHRLGDKSDNRASELRWATRKENMKYASDLGLLKRKKKINTLEDKV
jgi:hypothetical protein